MPLSPLTTASYARRGGHPDDPDVALFRYPPQPQQPASPSASGTPAPSPTAGAAGVKPPSSLLGTAVAGLGAAWRQLPFLAAPSAAAVAAKVLKAVPLKPQTPVAGLIKAPATASSTPAAPGVGLMAAVSSTPSSQAASADTMKASQLEEKVATASVNKAPEPTTKPVVAPAPEAAKMAEPVPKPTTSAAVVSRVSAHGSAASSATTATEVRRRFEVVRVQPASMASGSPPAAATAPASKATKITMAPRPATEWPLVPRAFIVLLFVFLVGVRACLFIWSRAQVQAAPAAPAGNVLVWSPAWMPAPPATRAEDPPATATASTTSSALIEL